MRHAEAHRRSTQLLKQNLSPTQLDQYERLSHFEVIGGCSGNRYRIRHGNVMNVELLNKKGKRIGLLCFMPEGRLPVGDIMLAQKMALELYENEAIQIANKMLPMDYFLDLELREHPRSRW
jgi:predicted metal-binding protein